MTILATKIEFENLSAFFCGRMISSDRETRIKAAADAEKLIRDLPKSLRNSPHCQDEIEAMAALIERVSAEGDDLARAVDKLNGACAVMREEIDEAHAQTGYRYAAAVPPASNLPTVPADGWSFVVWDGCTTRLIVRGVPADRDMPDYVSFSAGGNHMSTGMCLTPADARKVAAMLLQAANKAEGL